LTVFFCFNIRGHKIDSTFPKNCEQSKSQTTLTHHLDLVKTNIDINKNNNNTKRNDTKRNKTKQNKNKYAGEDEIDFWFFIFWPNCLCKFWI